MWSFPFVRSSSSRSGWWPAIIVGIAGLAAYAGFAALRVSGGQTLREWAIGQLGGTSARPAESGRQDAVGHADSAPYRDRVGRKSAGPDDGDHDHGTHEHAAHDHAGHAPDDSVEISPQARRSIGLVEGEVTLSTFRRTITVPGMVVERRGRSRFTVITPLTGYLTRILVAEGDTVTPDQPLFEIRLTHEELVQAQAELLRTTVEIDVVRREISRLEGIGAEGVIPARTILERKYELQKLEAVQLAQRQALLLHGLSDPQVEEIIRSRALLGAVVARAPGTAALDGPDARLVAQSLAVDRGQHVTAGDTLAVLVDHAALLIEGEAFEQDLATITEAAAGGRPVVAVVDAPGGQGRRLEGLRIAYVADRVAAESRTLRFYVALPNEAVNADPARGDGFVTWRYKPGQRMQLLVPVEEWPERIVLPAEAVAQDGIESYVFRVNGDHFDRETVHVEHREPQWVVIANDGTLFPGDRVAMSAAQQLHLAIKNRAGGGIDPHAGHSH